MKIAIIGAAGVRTPLIIQAMKRRQSRLGLTELALMDIDGEHLDLIGALTSPIEQGKDTQFHITRTTDARTALAGADFVITTFRVGGAESRVIDERVPLAHGILGQETTGAGGFSMGLRSIPVLLDYVAMMKQTCPDAWMINFANPAGMLAESVARSGGWQRVVGICDCPVGIHKFIAAILHADPTEVYLDYFGLNHLGWVKGIQYQNNDYLPELVSLAKSMGSVPGLPFDVDLITSLGMIPNEYLYYYYYSQQAINNILHAGETRGEQIACENNTLFSELKDKFDQKDQAGMQAAYQAYLDHRGATYMQKETGKPHDYSILDLGLSSAIVDEGYAGVALDLIEALGGDLPKVQILNIPNQGAIPGMEDLDVVEIPALVSRNRIQPLPASEIPLHCSGLIQQVKQYERLTIQAAVENSYSKALTALTIHPLVRDHTIAKSVLDQLIIKHKGYFPELL